MKHSIFALLIILLIGTTPVVAADSMFDPYDYTSVGGLTLTSGQSIDINTDSGAITGDVALISTVTDTDANGLSYRVFSFDSVTIGSGASVTFSGSMPVALLSQGDFTIAADLSRSGADGIDSNTGGTDGAAGGILSLVADGTMTVSATISADGGDGGNGLAAANLQEGGNGANAGTITLAAYALNNTGSLSAHGGDGGSLGGGAISRTFNLSDGGDGGVITIAQTETTLATTDVTGGTPFSFTFAGTPLSGALGIDGSVVFENTPTALVPQNPSIQLIDSPITIAENSGAVTQAGVVSSFDANDGGQSLVGYTLSNDNAALFTVQPAIDNTGTLTFTLQSNISGEAELSVYATDDGPANNQSATETITLIVDKVNYLPTFTVGSNQSVLEDAGPQSVTNFISDFDALDPEQSLVEYTVTNDNNALFDGASNQPKIANDGTLSYTSAVNAEGTATVSVTALDNGTDNNSSITQTFTITIQPVDDLPTFTVAGDQIVAEDAGPQTATDFINDFDPVDSGQTLVNYAVSNNNSTLFSATPQISNDGTLTYTSAINAEGSATVSVQGFDSGTSNNEIKRTFTITIEAVIDAPTFTIGSDRTVDEDSGAYEQAAFVTNFNANDPDQALVAYTVSNDNTALFSAQPAIDNDGRLTFTPADEAFGDATVSVYATDNGPSNTQSAPLEFTITINPLNDRPSFTVGTPPASNEDAGAQAVIGFVSDFNANDIGQEITAYVRSSYTSPDLFLVAPEITNDGTLTYTAASNASGSSLVYFSVFDDGSTFNQSALQNFVITVNSVNDAPTFVSAGDQSIVSEGVTTTVTDFLADLDAIESGQSLTITLTNDNEDLFFRQPAIDEDGELKYGVGDLSAGIATVTATVQDNGGTDFGGIDITTTTFQITASLSSTYPLINAAFDPILYEELGSLELDSGDSITIDTDAGTISGDYTESTPLSDLDADGVRYVIFNFTEIDIATGASVTIVGSTPLALLSQSDFYLGTPLSYDGADGASGTNGEGGGSLSLVADGLLTITNGISVNGGSGDQSHSGSGGNGGELSLASVEFSLSGTLAAVGGDGGSIAPANGGQGGTILIAQSDTTTANTDVSGGTPGPTSIGGNQGRASYTATPSYLGVPRFYVDASRSDQAVQDGLSWTTAFADLQDALASVESFGASTSSGPFGGGGSAEPSEIWVAAGLYYPDEAEASVADVTNDDMDATFVVSDAVQVYGGFSGSELTLDERNPDIYLTVLSGDLEQDDSGRDANGIVTDANSLDTSDENAKTIMTPDEGAEDIIIDGFVFTSGIAVGGSGASDAGGALYLEDVNPLIKNCTFIGNFAEDGGAVYGRSGSSGGFAPVFIQCKFLSNKAEDDGGAVDLFAYGFFDSIPEFVNCLFEGNEAVDAGGAMTLSTLVTPEFTGCAFIGNRTTGDYSTGGALAIRPAFNETLDYSFYACTFMGNACDGMEDEDEVSSGGGAIHIDQDEDSESDSVVLNLYGTLIYDNQDYTGSNSANASLGIDINGRTDVNRHGSLIEGYNDSTDNIDGTDTSLAPNFFTPLPFEVVPTIEGDARLLTLNSGIDASDSSYIPDDTYDLDNDGDTDEALPLDLNKAARLSDGEYDIGAYEYDASIVPPSGVENFRSVYDLASDGAEDADDLSQNGVSNLLYYAFGFGDPLGTQIPQLSKTSSSPGLPQIAASADEGAFTFQYVRRKESLDNGITYTIFESETLSNWLTYTPAVDDTTLTSIDDEYEIVTVTIRTEQPSAFYQIGITVAW